MPYIVGSTPQFIRKLTQLSQAHQESVERAMEQLATEPRPPEARGMFDSPDMYRVQLNVEVELVYRVYTTIPLVEMRRIRYTPL